IRRDFFSAVDRCGASNAWAGCCAGLACEESAWARDAMFFGAATDANNARSGCCAPCVVDNSACSCSSCSTTALARAGTELKPKARSLRSHNRTRLIVALSIERVLYKANRAIQLRILSHERTANEVMSGRTIERIFSAQTLLTRAVLT